MLFNERFSLANFWHVVFDTLVLFCSRARPCELWHSVCLKNKCPKSARWVWIFLTVQAFCAMIMWSNVHFLGIILAARRLRFLFVSWFYCKAHVCHVPSVINDPDLWSQIYVSLRTRQHTIAAQNEEVTKQARPGFLGVRSVQGLFKSQCL